MLCVIIIPIPEMKSCDSGRLHNWSHILHKAGVRLQNQQASTHSLLCPGSSRITLSSDIQIEQNPKVIAISITSYPVRCSCRGQWTIKTKLPALRNCVIQNRLSRGNSCLLRLSVSSTNWMTIHEFVMISVSNCICKCRKRNKTLVWMNFNSFI